MGLRFLTLYNFGDYNEKRLLLTRKDYPNLGQENFVDQIQAVVITAPGIPLELIFPCDTEKSNSRVYLRFDEDIDPEEVKSKKYYGTLVISKNTKVNICS